MNQRIPGRSKHLLQAANVWVARKDSEIAAWTYNNTDPQYPLRMYGNRSVACTRAARFLQDWLIAPRGIFVPQDGEGCRASYRHLHLWLGWSSAICWQTELEPYVWGHADPPQHACERYGCLLSWRRVQSFFVVADTRLSTVSGFNYK